jgi:PTS hybrid protein
MDVGSAVLTSKALLADLDDDRPDVRLVDAPLVEGAIAAAVTASTGQDLDAVVAAAEQARGMHKL